LLNNKDVLHIYAEPASYTNDLIKNVDTPNNIDYDFLKEYSKYNFESINYSRVSIRKFITILKNKNIVIINGYLNWVFLLLFFLRLISLVKIKIGIESDTGFQKTSFIKNFFKKFIFSKSFIFGLAGGYFSHKEYFLKNGMSESNVFVLPMMVDVQKFETNIIPLNNRVKFYFIGKFYSRKNIEFLLSSFKTAYKKNENIELNLIGDGAEFFKMEKLYGHFKFLKFFGKVKNKDINTIISGFHYIILPSLKEPWGLVINESYSSGKLALVSNRVGCIRDFKDLIQEWMIFDPFNKESLVKAILHAASNKDYTKLAKKASDFMSNQWNYSLYEKNLFKFLEYARKK
jgi:glycosyltransferase involved in cell wall biosynthesis